MRKDGYVVNLNGRDIEDKSFYFKGISDASRFFAKLVDATFDLTDSYEDNNGNSREDCKEFGFIDMGLCLHASLNETDGSEKYSSRPRLSDVNELVSMAI